MYNEQIKEEFLKTVNSFKYNMVFNVISGYEKRLEKDIYDFTAEELEEMFRGLTFKSKPEGWAFSESLNDYIEWSLKLELPRVNINWIDFHHRDWILQSGNE